MKRVIKIILSSSIAAVFAFSLIAANVVTVKSIGLDKIKLDLFVKETYSLKTTIEPGNATNKSLAFSSGNKNIATVNKTGRITAVRKGKTVITITSVSDKNINAKCSVNISTALYKDGTYTAQSDADSRGNYGKVTIIIKNGRMISVIYGGYLKDGTLKDENYGKGSSADSYNKAQNALKGAKTYGPKLQEIQILEKVDAVSGATNSYGDFKSAVQRALAKAKK
jgi:major membrane immunogen (membrane-anchored lipoprotein)